MNKTNTIPPLYFYVANLIAMYPFTKTVAHYTSNWPEECKRKDDDPFIIEIAKELSNDEKGHDRLILKDLETLKIPIEIALKTFQSESVKSYILHFKKSVSANHLHLLAWVYYIEKRMVNNVTAGVLQSYQKILGPFHKAMRFWKIHSAIGPERDHVEKRKQWIEALPAYQQQALRQETDHINSVLSDQYFDLDCKELDRFMNQHAPHLIDVAWGRNLWWFTSETFS